MKNKIPKKFPARGWRQVEVGDLAKLGDVTNPESWEGNSFQKPSLLAERFTGIPVQADWTPLFRRINGPR